MKLSTLLRLGVPAHHYKSWRMVDWPDVAERFIVIDGADAGGGYGGPDDFDVHRYVTPPKDFPKDGWIPIR